MPRGKEFSVRSWSLGASGRVSRHPEAGPFWARCWPLGSATNDDLNAGRNGN